MNIKTKLNKRKYFNQIEKINENYDQINI